MSTCYSCGKPITGRYAEHFSAIAAHELCHSYLYLNRYPDLPPRIEEGLANLPRICGWRSNGRRKLNIVLL